MVILWIGLGGFAGSISRYGVDQWFGVSKHDAFPVSTFTVNVMGCFLVGLLTALFEQRVRVDPAVRSALTIGFLGAYTTFSTFALQAMRLGEARALALALAYIAASVIVGLIAVVIGTWIGRSV
jgi:fluoride exporter